jgi:hypothetical protein
VAQALLPTHFDLAGEAWLSDLFIGVHPRSSAADPCLSRLANIR